MTVNRTNAHGGEAEPGRQNVHLAAMADQVWGDPFFTETFDFGGPVTTDDVKMAVLGGAERDSAPTLE